MTENAVVHYATLRTPIGEVLVVGDHKGLRRIDTPRPRGPHVIDEAWTHDPAALRGALDQLDAYFAGGRRAFDLPLAPVGTPFQLECWAALRTIPFGATVSYGEQARRIGRPAAARAVGAANGANPIGIVVPCHRVIGADGSLVGFGGGLPAKRWLLDHEARHASLFADVAASAIA